VENKLIDLASVLDEEWDKMHVSVLNISRPSTGDCFLHATLILPTDLVAAHRDAEACRRKVPNIGPGEIHGHRRSPYHVKLKYIRQRTSRNIQISGTDALSYKLAHLQHKNGSRRLGRSRSNVVFR
jgi:hypothetical protein